MSLAGKGGGRTAAEDRRGRAPFDRWSWWHLAAGAALGFLPWPWHVLGGLLLLFELAEAALRRLKVRRGGVFEYESWPNIAVDVALGVAGIAAVRVALASVT